MDKGAKNMGEIEARVEQFDEGLADVFKKQQTGELAKLKLSK